MLRSSPPELFSKKDALQTWRKPTGKSPCRTNRFATLLKSHPHMDAHPKTHPKNTLPSPPREHLWETAFVCQKRFKRLEL